MLRFITQNLTTIDGVSIYPIFSLLVFVLFFTVMIARVVRMKKKDIVELSNLPFDDNLETSDVNVADQNN
ncbi:MAG: CcoQ/FixQ family Cbb3-type cytochrome c oxidase assembly chaperone [Crocinitomicaceae bacterium]